MTAPADEMARAVPSVVLGLKIDNLATEVLELRRELRSVVRIDLWEESRRADQRRIEQTENTLREFITSNAAQRQADASRREADERDRAARRWQLGLATLAAVVSVVLALVKTVH